MTREEHIRWCKERAIKEYDYYAKTEPQSAVRNGIASMMSDLTKHSETNSQTLQMLCITNMMTIRSRSEFVNFINGFN